MRDVRFITLFDYYSRLDTLTSAFRASTGLSCTPGCGWCCETGDPEITVFEAMPLACTIVSNPFLMERYNAYRGAGTRKPCFFHDASRDFRCTAYAIRPMMCRMFGYAGVRDKNGAVRFKTCPKMRNSARPVTVPLIPVFQDLQLTVTSLAPSELARLLPFPDALSEAVDRETIRRRLSSENGDGTNCPLPVAS